MGRFNDHFDDLVQDCSNSSANALELLQSCTKPSSWRHPNGLSYYHSEMQVATIVSELPLPN